LKRANKRIDFTTFTHLISFLSDQHQLRRDHMSPLSLDQKQQ